VLRIHDGVQMFMNKLIGKTIILSVEAFGTITNVKSKIHDKKTNPPD